MKSYIKKHIKTEKRIIKLLFRKGLLHDNKINIDSLGWEALKRVKRQRKRDHEYVFHDYLPELHGYTVDYWGEGDSYGVVDLILDWLYWENSIPNTADESTCGYPESTFKCKSRKWFIKYLESLPTRFTSCKINEVLRRGVNW